MSRLPPLDGHAHIDPSIAGADLDALNSVVLAMTRSLSEAEVAVQRTDTAVVWGVGSHPALPSAHAEFTEARFKPLLESTMLAGELGLDGRARVSMDKQRATLRSALAVLAETPRITSLHSAHASSALLDELAAIPIHGAVLHWWLGDATLTRKALDAGCYFSLNPAGVRRKDLLSMIPLDRLLTETDHPYGDRRTTPHRPGNVLRVELAFARHHGVSPEEVRRQMWRNFAALVKTTGVGRLVPRSLRSLLAAVS